MEKSMQVISWIQKTWVFGATLVALIACRPAGLSTMPEPALPITTPYPGVRIIDKSTSPSLTTVKLLSTTDDSPITALQVEPAAHIVYVVQASGRLTHIDVLRGIELQTFNISPTGLTSTSFLTTSPRLVIGAGGSTFIGAIYSSGITDISIWDVSTGKLTSRLEEDKWEFASVSASPNGAWAVGVFGAIFNCWDVSMNKLVKRAILGNTHMDKVAFSANSNAIAVSDKNGLLEIILNPCQSYLSSGWRIQNSGSNLGFTTHAMLFAPTNEWLAVIRDQRLLIYHKANPGPPHANILITSMTVRSGALAFDATGDLLAVASNAGVQIYDVAQGHKLFEDNSVVATAVGFSPDNHLLVVGDARGNVRVYGVR